MNRQNLTDNEIDLMRIAFNAGKVNHDGNYRALDFEEWMSERFEGWDQEVTNEAD